MPNRITNGLLVLLCAFVCTFAVSFDREARAENYSSLLVKGLLRLGYRMTRDDVVALDRISMRFDSRNRIDVLTRIINDRQSIHAMETGDAYEKTEVICNALRLLDEINLPVTREIVAGLVQEDGWQEKERRMLCYMAAKRDIDIGANTRILIESMPSQETDLQRGWGGEISLSIMDICDNLSYLTELFVYRGDRDILDALIKYAGRSYGYPKEYLSYMFVEILLQRPRLFIDILSEKDEQSVDPVINSLLFAIWRNDAKSKVDALLQEELGSAGYEDNRIVKLFRRRLEHFAQHNEMKRQEAKSVH